MGAPLTIGAFSTERAGGVSRTPYDDGSGSGGGGFNLGTHTGDDPGHVLQNRTLLRRMLPLTKLDRINPENRS